MEQAIFIRLVDLQGRVLQEYRQLHGQGITYILPVSDLPVGAYVVQVLETGSLFLWRRFWASHIGVGIAYIAIYLKAEIVSFVIASFIGSYKFKIHLID
ncbi:MAG: hypothetical protein GY810_13160 [Aureispira sp.]|nr:hypothetical protein [Aureispira sp.]